MSPGVGATAAAAARRGAGPRAARARRRRAPVLLVDDEGEVELTVLEVGDQVPRPALVDLQRDAGVAVVEDREDVGEHADAQARCGADPQPPAAQPGELRDLEPRGLDVGDDPPGQGQQGLARHGQCDVVVTPCEQGLAEIIFE